MGTLGVFDFVTLDGFFAGPRGEIDWFKGIPKDEANAIKKKFEEVGAKVEVK